MSVTLPKYGLVAPSETTYFRDLGKELREFGQSIEDILESFDYTGADPNLVLARVNALEAWQTDAEQRVAALEDDTGMVDLMPHALSGWTGELWGRRRNGVVEITGEVSGVAVPSQTQHQDLAPSLPPEFHPTGSARLGVSSGNGFAGGVRVHPTSGRLRLINRSGTNWGVTTTIWLNLTFIQ